MREPPPLNATELEKEECRLVGCEEVAYLICQSVQTVQKMNREGRMPKAITVNRRHFWRIGDIRKWIANDLQPPKEEQAA